MKLFSSFVASSVNMLNGRSCLSKNRKWVVVWTLAPIVRVPTNANPLTDVLEKVYIAEIFCVGKRSWPKNLKTSAFVGSKPVAISVDEAVSEASSESWLGLLLRDAFMKS